MITKDEKNNIFKEIFAFIDSEKFKLDFTHINSMERFAIKKSNIKNTTELLKEFYSYSKPENNNSLFGAKGDDVFYTINLEKKQLLVKKASKTNINEFNILNRKFLKSSFSHKLFGFLNSTASEKTIKKNSDLLFLTFKQSFKESMENIQAEYINDFLVSNDRDDSVFDKINTDKILFNLDNILRNPNQGIDLYDFEYQLKKYDSKYEKNLFLIKGTDQQVKSLIDIFNQIIKNEIDLSRIHNETIQNSRQYLLLQSPNSFKKYLDVLIKGHIYNAKIFVYVLLMFHNLISENQDEKLILNQIKLKIVQYLNDGIDNYNLSDILENSFKYKQIENVTLSEIIALLDSEYEIFKYHAYPKYLFTFTLKADVAILSTIYYANFINQFYKINMLRFSKNFKELDATKVFEIISALQYTSEDNKNDLLIEDLRSFCNL